MEETGIPTSQLCVVVYYMSLSRLMIYVVKTFFQQILIKGNACSSWQNYHFIDMYDSSEEFLDMLSSLREYFLQTTDREFRHMMQRQSPEAPYQQNQ